GWHAGRLWQRADAGSLVGLAVGGLASAGIWAWAPGATNIAVGATIAVIVVSSLVARRRNLAGVWSLPLLALGAVAVATWVLGTRASPLCQPDNWLQPHGFWHALTAIMVIGWVDAAYGAGRPEQAPRLFRHFVDRTLGLAARGLVLGFHRSVDVSFR